MNQRTCPKCGHVPVRKPGKICPYQKCDGSGLLPFVGKDGKVRSGAHTFCDCHSIYGIDTQEHYMPVLVDDYDFPMSSTFRAQTYEDCGVLDPGKQAEMQPELEGKPTQSAPWQIKEFTDNLHRLQVFNNDLMNRLNRHIDASKYKKGEY